MARRSFVAVASVALALLLTPAARAGEPEPWGGEEPERQREMEEMAEAAMLGHLDPEERAEVDRYWATHLRRCPMDAIQSAQYAIAEIQLQQRNPKAAVAALQKVVGGEAPAHLRHVTHLNIAEIARRHLRDAETAVTHYRKVGGSLRHFARHYMLGMLLERGKTTEAAKILEQLVAVADEPGEKLALLHEVAALYKRAGMPDRALAAYQRITKEFAPADIKKMREAAALEAQRLLREMHERGEREDGRGAERAERRLHERARDLRLGRRTDEFEAFRAAMEEGFRRLERRGREEEEREERQRGDRDRRERDGDDRRPREGREHKPGEF
jgi:tetratricopeptide (TPR) repeat protein